MQEQAVRQPNWHYAVSSHLDCVIGEQLADSSSRTSRDQ